MEQFIADVTRMRDAQRQFFKQKNKVNLREAIRLGAIVDKQLKNLQKGEPVKIQLITNGDLFK